MGKGPLRIVQQWDGVVDHADGEIVYATMRDLTNPAMPDEEWQFSSVNVPEDQRHLIAPGAVFTFDIWSNSTWVVKFRDEKWTQEEIDRIHQHTKEITTVLGIPYPKDTPTIK